MARIIAGAAGSLRLRVPRSGTRPTSDRVREAVFSSLAAEDAVDGARVLDLYAGSGALGLEAMSRGAGSAVLVDRGVDQAAVCRANAALVTSALKLPKDAVRTVRQGVGAFLAEATAGAPVAEEAATETAAPEGTGLSGAGRFDLAFIDPPYELGEPELAATLTALVPALAPGATVVVERSSRSPDPIWPPGLEPLRRRAYGETVIHLAHRG